MRYTITKTFLAGALKGLTIADVSPVSFEVGKTYGGGWTGSRYRVDGCAPIPEAPDAKALALAFAAEVRDVLGEHLADINERNASEAYRASKSCATHDHCDANMLMLDAFQKTFGRDPLFLEGTDAAGQFTAAQDADTDAWNAAWAMASDSRFALGDDMAAMTAEFAAFTRDKPHLQEGDALELLMGAPLTDEERAWVSDFILRWDVAEKAPDFYGHAGV